jgi:hypothetical protein
MVWRVFYSYSHRDAELRERLGTYLAPLVLAGKIVEWHDRKIEPGTDWENEISDQLESANLILFLVSEDFLASEYCFGVEVDKALSRLKAGEVKVVPILLKPCLWKESRFSELQIIPRDAKAIISWPSREEAFVEVATELNKMVSESQPVLAKESSKSGKAAKANSSIELVRGQVRSYAQIYERIRQRMRPSDDRTKRMEQVLQRMRELATASYPLLDDLANSPSPGERLAAVAILQTFAHERYLPLLVKLIGSETPFVGYQATRALQFAVGALSPRLYPLLLEVIAKATNALESARAGFDTDRQTLLREAEKELRASMDSISIPPR